MSTASVFQLKVILQYVKPPVWRRLLVPADITLAKLHGVLQVTMGWDDSHMHHFEAAGVFYGPPEPDFGLGDPPIVSESRARLGDLLVAVKSAMLYEYDFGDGWMHRIVLEKVREPSPDEVLPLCLDGKGACPPDDCGGPPGYEDLLRVLADPADEEHEAMLEWLGGPFDPAAFDLVAVNAALRPRKRAAAKRSR